MEKNIFIPNKINVGFKKDEKLYTKKLSLIIYFDKNGNLNNKKEWNKLRDKELGEQVFDNVPTKGFILNKNKGEDLNSIFNKKRNYISVYDPRGFEVAITIDNLLYILEHTSLIKDKGFEGEFIYLWNNNDLFLYPATLINKLDIKNQHNTLKVKDLIIGAVYIDKNNREMVYLGKYPEYYFETFHQENSKQSINNYLTNCKNTIQRVVKSKPIYWFWHLNNTEPTTYININNIVSLKSEKFSNFKTMLEAMQHNSRFSPLSNLKTKYKNVDFDYINQKIHAKDNLTNTIYVYCGENKTPLKITYHDYLKTSAPFYSITYNFSSENIHNIFKTNTSKKYLNRFSNLETLVNILNKPKVKIEYLENGNIKDEVKYSPN